MKLKTKTKQQQQKTCIQTCFSVSAKIFLLVVPVATLTYYWKQGDQTTALELLDCCLWSPIFCAVKASHLTYVPTPESMAKSALLCSKAALTVCISQVVQERVSPDFPYLSTLHWLSKSSVAHTHTLQLTHFFDCCSHQLIFFVLFCAKGTC